MHVIRVHKHGGPEAMALEQLDTPTPGSGQLLVAVEAAGVNFIDVYLRTGAYPRPAPVALGLEGAGQIVAQNGQSSGRVPPIDAQQLNSKGSLFLTRPSLFHHMATREELLARANDVLGWLQSGELRVTIDRTLPLSRAAEAHALLEGRQTSGKLLLLPGRDSTRDSLETNS